MAIAQEPALMHWNYFLALEEDLGTLSRFLEITEANSNAFSIEMTHLFLAAASEVDVVMKQYCAILAPDAPAKNIDHYKTIICRARPEFSAAIASLPRFGITLRPWSNWLQNQTPDWWREHNQVKHQRFEYFASANLKNVLNALGGLFLLLVMYYREQGTAQRLVPAPVLFQPDAQIARRAHSMGGETGLYFVR